MKKFLLEISPSHIPLFSGFFDAMVSSTCSTASIESAPGGFPGFATDVAADVVTDGKHSMALIQRPYSVETGCGYGETNASMELQLLGKRSAYFSVIVFLFLRMFVCAGWELGCEWGLDAPAHPSTTIL